MHPSGSEGWQCNVLVVIAGKPQAEGAVVEHQ
jgi:hypothetical protein